MKTKIIYVFVLLLLLSKTMLAQAPGKKWINVLDMPDQQVYIDTSSVKLFDNQITVLSLTTYKEPQLITSLNKEATMIKSQILFNAATKKYTVIGTLYYDSKLKILGETSVPGIAAGGENFSIPIDSNKVITAIYNKVLQKLNLGNTSTVEKSDINKGEPNKVSLNQKVKEDNKSVERKSNSIKPAPVQKDTTKKLVIIKPKEKDPSIKIVDDLTKRKEVVKPPIVEQKKIADEESENGSETSPRNLVFTDGSKYSFQASSWKNKSVAEGEVKRLKNEGHNAFIVEAIVKGVTRYRVRIGYFNSLDETEAYMKKMK